MSTEENGKTERRGGFRCKAGRKKGSGTKTKICVSVDEQNWQAAISRWDRKRSWLVNALILRYVETNGGILETKAAI
jgi:hypothetical protein